MDNWKVCETGCYRLIVNGYQFEIGDGPHGTWRLNVVELYKRHVATVDCETLQDAFNVAAMYIEDIQQ